MSTETFTPQSTSSFLGKILSLLVPEISSQEADLIRASIRKAGHVTEYFILCLLLFRAFRGGSAAAWNWRWFWGAFIVVVLWAVIGELHQSFVPTRTVSFMDVGLDTAGRILAQFVIVLWYRFTKR